MEPAPIITLFRWNIEIGGFLNLYFTVFAITVKYEIFSTHNLYANNQKPLLLLRGLQQWSTHPLVEYEIAVSYLSRRGVFLETIFHLSYTLMDYDFQKHSSPWKVLNGYLIFHSLSESIIYTPANSTRKCWKDIQGLNMGRLKTIWGNVSILETKLMRERGYDHHHHHQLSSVIIMAF